MRHRLFRLIVSVSMVGWFVSAPGGPAAFAAAPAPAEQSVTFAEHIAPLVFANCTSCHRPGEAAPFVLQNYRQTRKHARAMLEQMEARSMPPWQPEPGYGDFRDSRRLSDQQISLFRRWVDTGMSEGDPARVPAPPEFPGGWTLGTPDLVVSMDQAYPVPADGPDIYRNFVLPLHLTEKKWVTAVEIRPSAPTVVHHVLYFLDSSGNAAKQNGTDGKPGFPGMGFRPTGRLGGWAVGATPRRLPDGLAWPLPKNADLVLQTHFHPSGTAEAEKLTIALYFADRPPTRTLTGVMLPPVYSLFSGLDIPAGKNDFTIRDSFTLPVDVDVIGAGAHAHILGKSLKAVAELPDKSVKPLFWIKDWDFNWQGQYYYTHSIRLPKGTVLRGEVIWDNSADNPRNPRVPPTRVTWGEATNDEMGSVSLMMVAAKESETSTLNTAYRLHVREAMLRAAATGDTKLWKKLGINSGPAPASKEAKTPSDAAASPAPAKK
jgi:hypothetical protein